MVTPRTVFVIAHPGNGYWPLLRDQLAARDDVTLVSYTTAAETALSQLATLLAPPELVLASPLAPAARTSTEPSAFAPTLAQRCSPATIAFFSHTYDPAFDRLRWRLGVSSYLCWDELMDDAEAPRRLRGVLEALLAGVAVQSASFRLAGRASLPPATPAVPLTRDEQFVLRGLLRGWTHPQIAHALAQQRAHGSERQIERLLKQLQVKYGVTGTHAVVACAVLDGALDESALWQDPCLPWRDVATSDGIRPDFVAEAGQHLAGKPLPRRRLVGAG